MKPFSNDSQQGPSPEDFPLGSPESRAAARMLAQRRDSESEPDVRFIWDIPVGTRASADINDVDIPTRRYKLPDGRTCEFVFEIPKMTGAGEEKQGR
jgi:hypothetical protein